MERSYAQTEKRERGEGRERERDIVYQELTCILASVASVVGISLDWGTRVFITNVKGTFLGMSESEEASKRR